MLSIFEKSCKPIQHCVLIKGYGGYKLHVFLYWLAASYK